MLSQLRMYRLNLTLAHEHLAQLDEEVQDAVLGNVGTLISFRVGPRDAEVLEREFGRESEYPGDATKASKATKAQNATE